MSDTRTANPRVVVCGSAGGTDLTLPPYEGSEQTRLAGGERTLLEVAAAAAALGHTVELRGRHVERVVEQTEHAVGVRLARPQTERASERDEVVIVPEGVADPLYYARVALSPARAVLLALAPPGLFGWSFTGSDGPATLASVDPASVGRPEQLAAAHALGFELWSNFERLDDAAAAAGVRCHQIGAGRPSPYPPPVAKTVDVVSVADNRWAPVARAALRTLPPDVLHEEIPSSCNDQLLRRLASARILVHPCRIEGRSRLSEEAMAMGTVVIALRSNRFLEGAWPEGGAVLVNDVDELAPMAATLIDDPARMAEIAERGTCWAARVGDWPRFVARVGTALAQPDAALARGAAARGSLGAALTAREQLATASAERTIALLQERLDDAEAQLDAVSQAALFEHARYTHLRQRRAVRIALRLAAALARERDHAQAVAPLEEAAGVSLP